MKSRMDRYYDTNENNNTNSDLGKTSSSRTNRNQELYKEVSSLEINNFDLNSNVSVIGEGTDNIDISKIKNIIDEKYRETPKNKSIGDALAEDMPKINLDETREYDLNAIMQKAKSAKEVNYEEDRLKKLRNTQYDILKNLNINRDDEEKDVNDELDDTSTQEMVNISKEEKESKEHHANTKEKQLLDLINTITAKELLRYGESTKELDPLDILSDLRGDDENTKVMGAIEQEKLEKENQDTVTVVEVQGDKNFDKTQNSEITEVVKAIANANADDDTTNEITTLRNNDYEDFSDLRQDMKATRLLVKILIIIIVLVFIVGCVLLANKLFNLGLF